MSNPLLSPVSSVTALLDRVDWNKAFIRVAIVLNAVGILYVGYVYSIYAAYFGYSALAFIGQFLIGIFFMNVVVSNPDGLQVMLASVGMFILANSF